LNFEPVGVDVVQMEDVLFDREHALCAINSLWLHLIAAGQREANRSHEHVSFGVGNAANQQQP
jgi:hypothetical protein